MSHFVRAFKNSVKGIRACYRTEVSFRQEIRIFAVMFPLSFFVAQSVVEWLLLVGSMILVLIVELLNTAVENTLDKTVPQYSKHAGMAKDQGSAAVYFSLILAGMVWVSLIWVNWADVLKILNFY